MRQSRKQKVEPTFYLHRCFRVKKRIIILLVTLMLLFFNGTISAKASSPITFQDDLGRTLILEKPKRVAALIGSFADIWCLAGGKDTLVATANEAWTEFDLDLDNSVIKLGTTTTLSMDMLLASEPDLVLASCNTSGNLQLQEALENLRIPVAYFRVSTFEDYLRMLSICTELCDRPENFQIYGLNVQQDVEKAKKRVDGSQPTVLYIRASGSQCKVKNSQNSVLGEMLQSLGCRNIADSDSTLLENLNLEAIVMKDPDYIFAVLQGKESEKAQQRLKETLLNHPAWQSLSAVQNGRFYLMDYHLYNLKPNARWGEAYEKLSAILYPEK